MHSRKNSGSYSQSEHRLDRGKVIAGELALNSGKLFADTAGIRFLTLPLISGECEDSLRGGYDPPHWKIIERRLIPTALSCIRTTIQKSRVILKL